MPCKQQYDIAIIGGGPAGSTVGTLLKKYAPQLEVLILERERFPRDHVGESQLPRISNVLDEMGCWDKVEAAGFPIKIGATYRWGNNPELWDFEFLPLAEFKDEPRPARFEGQRRRTAFQVERARYDKILLDHAAEMGCTVWQETKVVRIESENDEINNLLLQDERQITARYYVDASGASGILRRALGVTVTVPTSLKNIAIWDYWENAEWAVEIGVGGTRVQVMSIANGWIWFIPLSPTRTSIGFICPVDYYSQCGLSAEQLYLQALPQDPRILSLLKNADREGKLSATKDWSFLADRMVGVNWFLAGECAGFADPILAAGMTLAHHGAREVAYTLLALEQGEHDPAWLKQHYEDTQKKRIGQHIRFAEFWYAANGQFTDLQDYTAKIAADAGLDLSPEEAFRWLSTGGFANDTPGQALIGSFDLASMKQVLGLFAGESQSWALNRYNWLALNLDGAKTDQIPLLHEGKIHRQHCFVREGRSLPVAGLYQLNIEILKRYNDISDIIQQLLAYFQHKPLGATPQIALYYALQSLEVMLSEGWLQARFDPNRPRLTLTSPIEGAIIHRHHG